MSKTIVIGLFFLSYRMFEFPTIEWRSRFIIWQLKTEGEVGVHDGFLMEAAFDPDANTSVQMQNKRRLDCFQALDFEGFHIRAAVTALPYGEASFTEAGWMKGRLLAGSGCLEVRSNYNQRAASFETTPSNGIIKAPTKNRKPRNGTDACPDQVQVHGSGLDLL